VSDGRGLEPGGAIAAALEGDGRGVGELSQAGEHFVEQGEELAALAGGELVEGVALEDADAARRRSAMARPASVISTSVLRRSSGVGHASAPTTALQQIQSCCGARRGDQHAFADLGRRQRSAGAVKDRQGRGRWLADAEARLDRSGQAPAEPPCRP
jgi:hypothetical protein